MIDTGEEVVELSNDVAAADNYKLLLNNVIP